MAVAPECAETSTDVGGVNMDHFYGEAESVHHLLALRSSIPRAPDCWA